MSSRKVRALAGSVLLALALLLHFAGCKWGSENDLSDPPFITLRKDVTVDEQQAVKAKLADDLRREYMEEINKLVGTDQSLVLRKLEDADILARYSALVDEVKRCQQMHEEASLRAYGKFGLYPRGSRDSSLVLGLILPAIFLVGGLILIAWAVPPRRA